MLYFILILLLLVGSALTLITLQNLEPQHAYITVFAWHTPDLPLGLLVLLAFLLGALLLYIVSIFSALPDYHEIRRLRARVKELEKQVEMNAQQTPPQGPPSGPILPMPGMPSEPLEP